MELAERTITTEHEKSFVINLAQLIAIWPYIVESNERKDLKLVTIQDLYIGPLGTGVRIRSEEGRVCITRKVVDTGDSDKFIEDTIDITSSLEQCQLMVKSLLSNLFDTNCEQGLRKLSIKVLLPAIAELIKSYFVETFYREILFSNKFTKFVPKRLDKKRIIINLTDGIILHVDIYYGRMIGLIKTDLEFPEGLTKERENELSEEYEALLRGYSFTSSEILSYQKKGNYARLLPHQMVATSRPFFLIDEVIEDIIKQLDISEDDIPYIQKIIDSLDNKSLFELISNNLIEQICNN